MYTLDFLIFMTSCEKKDAQNDHVLTFFLTRIKLAVNSQGSLGNRMNIKTIENNKKNGYRNELEWVLLDF